MYRAEDMLWHLAIWTARIGQPAEAMGVVGLWHKRPTTLLATAKQLGLPCHVVFSVYSACHALGLVVDRRARQLARVSKQGRSRSTLLLGSMLDKLRKFTGSH